MSTTKVPGANGIIQNEPLLWEKGKKGRRGMCVPQSDVPEAALAQELQGPPVDFPDLSEVDVVRHYTRLQNTVGSGPRPLYVLISGRPTFFGMILVNFSTFAPSCSRPRDRLIVVAL